MDRYISGKVCKGRQTTEKKMILLICALVVALLAVLAHCCYIRDEPCLEPCPLNIAAKRPMFIETSKSTGIYCIEIAEDVEEDHSDSSLLLSLELD